MDAEGVDGLIVYGEHEMAEPAPFALDSYFTNDSSGTIVVFSRGAEPVCLRWRPAYLGEPARQAGKWIQPENNRIATHARGLADLLIELILAAAAIGVIGLEPRPPFPFNPIAPYTMGATALLLPRAMFKPVWHNCLLCILREEPTAGITLLEYAAAAGEPIATELLREAAAGEPIATELLREVAARRPGGYDRAPADGRLAGQAPGRTPAAA
jgi:hypothetical protein